MNHGVSLNRQNEQVYGSERIDYDLLNILAPLLYLGWQPYLGENIQGKSNQVNGQLGVIFRKYHAKRPEKLELPQLREIRCFSLMVIVQLIRLAFQNQYKGESEKLRQFWVTFQLLLLSFEKLVQLIKEEFIIESRILVRSWVSGLDYLADDSLNLPHDVLGLGLHFHDLLAELKVHLQYHMAV